MSEKIKNFVIVSVSLMWLLAFAFLGYSVSHPLQWLALAALAILTMFIVFLLLQSLKEQKVYSDKIKFTNALTATLANQAEYIVFDEQGRTLYTTHPHIYPHQKEFLRKVLLRINPSPESVMFKQWVEEHHAGEVILTGGGNGLGQSQKRWLAKVIPMDPTLMRGQNLLLVMLTDLTHYLEGLSNLRESHKNLEAFIDEAPFALFYASPSKHLVGANATLSEWLNIDKDDLVGQPIQQFIDEYDHRIADEKIRIVTLKPFKKNHFKALWFPPKNNTSKYQASIICKLDDQSIMKSSHGDSYLVESTFMNARIAAAIIDIDGKILGFNPSFSSMITEAISLKNNELQGANLFNFIEEASKAEVSERLSKACENRETPQLLEILFEGNKTHTTAYASLVEHSIDPNLPAQLMVQFIDISEQKRLEQQFIQSQKMQAVGQLAGGIAHDFNNLLTAMIGFCDLLLQRYMPNDPSYTDIIQIKQNANRAANLVRQLLAFSRQQTLQPRVMNITDVLSELSALLRRLIGAGTELQIYHGRDLWPVRADMSQFEQVIINLAVNARDAMEGGGQLTIQTSNFHCNKPIRLGHEILPKGDYSLIEVSDTGHGIPLDIVERIFEPFFSTKEVGAGTGLGLSTVYGIVKQTGGFIFVESTVNVGTRFKIYLPRFHGAEDLPQEQVVEAPASDLTGGETILLVEDEDAVRMFSSRALREKGYKVIEAESGETALELIESGQKFDLLVTDVVMPKMDGPTLNKKIRDLMPDVKTIFISGYTEDTFRKNLGHNAQIHFLAKPFTLKDLATKVRDVLNSK